MLVDEYIIVRDKHGNIVTDPNKIDLSPGCGTIIEKKVGANKATLVFSSNKEESLKARKKFVEFMIENAKRVEERENKENN